MVFAQYSRSSSTFFLVSPLILSGEVSFFSVRANSIEGFIYFSISIFLFGCFFWNVVRCMCILRANLVVVDLTVKLWMSCLTELYAFLYILNTSLRSLNRLRRFLSLLYVVRSVHWFIFVGNWCKVTLFFEKTPLYSNIGPIRGCR